MSPLLRKMGWSLAVVLTCAYAVVALRGPQGVPALLEKWDEVRKLEQENADLEAKIRQKRERIRELQEKDSALEMELRKDLLQMKPGEKTLILPESSEPAAEPAAETQPE